MLKLLSNKADIISSCFIISDMADIPVADTTAGVDGDVEPMFGVLDIFLLGVSLGIGVYWFFFRGKKKEDDKAIKTLKVV